MTDLPNPAGESTVLPRESRDEGQPPNPPRSPRGAHGDLSAPPFGAARPASSWIAADDDDEDPPPRGSRSATAPSRPKDWLSSLEDERDFEPQRAAAAGRPSEPSASGWLGALADRDEDPVPPAAPKSAPPARSDWLSALSDHPEPHSAGAAPESRLAGEVTPHHDAAPGTRRRDRLRGVVVALAACLAIETVGLAAAWWANSNYAEPLTPTAPGSASTAPGGTAPTGAAAKKPVELVVSAKGGRSLTSLATAIEQALPGATIKVKPGTYREPFIG